MKFYFCVAFGLTKLAIYISSNLSEIAYLPLNKPPPPPLHSSTGTRKGKKVKRVGSVGSIDKIVLKGRSVEVF